MAAVVTHAVLGAILKKIFERPGKVFDACFKDHPVFKIIQKEKGFGGGLSTTAAPYAAGFQLCPIKYARGGGRSATWLKAVNNAKAPGYKGFILDAVNNYVYQTIDPKILASANNEIESFVTGMEKRIKDDVLENLGNNMAIDLFRDGSGALGYVDTTWGGASTTIPIEEPESDIRNFEVGDVLVSALDTTSALYDAGAELTVTAVSPMSSPPTITVDSLSGHTQFCAAAGTAVPLFTSGDYVSASDRLKLSGFDAWIPATVTATPFKGVDRSIHEQRLGGCRLNMTGFTAKESVIRTKTMVAKFNNGRKCDTFVCSPDYWEKLELELEEQGVYNRDAEKQIATVGYEFLKVGNSTIVSDAFCPDNRLWGLTKDTWTLYWMGDDVAFLMDYDGSILCRVPASTGTEYEFRGVSWSELGCHLPGANCRTTVSL